MIVFEVLTSVSVTGSLPKIGQKLELVNLSGYQFYVQNTKVKFLSTEAVIMFVWMFWPVVLEPDTCVFSHFY